MKMNNNINYNFEQPEENLGYLLWQTTMLWNKQMNRALDEINLTHTQFVIMAALGWLSKKSDNVTQKDIADASNTDRMMVSKILRKLEQNKLIKRKEHETDTRAKCVSLTQKGMEITQKALEIKDIANKKFFKNISDKQKFGKELLQVIG